MTIQTTTNTISYDASGSQQSFAYNFIVVNATDMQVYEDGVLTVEAYTVSGLGNPAGGTVDFTTYTPAAGIRITLLRSVPLTQLVDYKPYDPFPAETHESALDKLTMQTQQLQEESDRSFKFEPGSPESNVTWESLVGNADKAYIVNPGETGFIAGPTSTEIENAESYANAAAASAAAAAASASAAASSASAAAASAVDAAASAALAAETNAVNLIPNADFGIYSQGDVYNWGSAMVVDNMAADNIADWAIGTGTLAFVTDHYTLTHSAANARRYNSAEVVDIKNSRVFRVTAQVKNGTASGVQMRFVYDNGSSVQFGNSFVTTASFVEQTQLFRTNLTSGVGRVGFEAITNLAGNNIQIKLFYCIEIIRADTAGGNSGPEGWGRTHSTLNVYRDPDTTKANPTALYAIKNAATLEQVFWPDAVITDYTREYWLRQFRGRTVTFGAWVSASNPANKLRLSITDGVTISYSPYVTVTGTYQWIEVSKVISDVATSFYIAWDLEGDSADSGYMAQPMLIYGSGIGVGKFVPRSDQELWLATPKTLTHYSSATVSADVAIEAIPETEYVVPFGTKALYIGLNGINSVVGNHILLRGVSSYGIIVYSSTASQRVSGMGWVPLNTNGDMVLARTGTWTGVEITVHAVKY